MYVDLDKTTRQEGFFMLIEKCSDPAIRFSFLTNKPHLKLYSIWGFFLSFIKQEMVAAWLTSLRDMFIILSSITFIVCPSHVQQPLNPNRH